jgi:putative NADH-flavin reductase
VRRVPQRTLNHRALLVTRIGEAIMDVAVFGATGRTGSRLVRQSVARGYGVVAIARDAARIESMPGVRAVSADAGDTAALAAAFPGVDVVLFALGHSKTSGEGVLATGIRSTIAAMAQAGVQRLIAIGASGYSTDGDGFVARSIVKPVRGRILRDQYDDMREMEEVIRNSATAWTIVRPPKLLDKSGSGHYRSRIDENVKGGFTISRDDLATAILDLAETPSLARKVVSVAA